MSDKLRIGVIGLGRFVEIAHLPTYYESQYSGRIEVAAISDLSEARLAEVGERHNIKARYRDPKEMLGREKLDAVTIITPDHTHTPLVMAALEAGLDVLVEKPLAMTARECHQVIKAAKKANRRVRTDFHKRFDLAHQDARHRLADGRYGRVQFGYVWMQDTISIAAGPFFKSNLAHKSSPVWFLGVHFFDCVRFITGLLPVRVTATGYRQVLEPEKNVPTYDAVKADIVYENGAAISFYLSWNLPDGYPALTRQGIYLQCTHGDVTVDTWQRGYYESSKEGYKHVNSMFMCKTPSGYRGYGVESIGEVLMEYLDIRNRGDGYRQERERAEPSAVNGFWAAVMGQATDASLAAGQKIDGGKVIVGAPVEINDLLKRELGDDAAEYAVKYH